MSRSTILAGAAVVGDTVLLVGVHRSTPIALAALYAVAAATVVVAARRSAVASFLGALVLASCGGLGYGLLLWAAYQAGRHVSRQVSWVALAGASLGSVAASLVRAGELRVVPHVLSQYAIFVAFPLLTGRYLAAQRQLLTTLRGHNRELARTNELLGEQERLRERLRIARDMHDSLGHRLSLVSVQAAALEVAALPEPHQRAVTQLASAARGAMSELYELIGALRGDDEAGPAPGLASIDDVVSDFREAGVDVVVRRRGEPAAITEATGQVAFRIVQEGLTNAAKHATEAPVQVSLEWEPDALLVSVTNPLTASQRPAPSGHGLAGLAERALPLGGYVDFRQSDEDFRLFAMLPTRASTSDEMRSRLRPARAAMVGVAAAALIFIILPASMLLGIR